MEPRDRAAQDVTGVRDRARSRVRLRRGCACSSSGWRSPVARAAGRRHQVRPASVDPAAVPGARAAPVGPDGGASASCRTRPTATCGRWVRSSSLGHAARRSRLGGPAAVVALVLCVAFLGVVRLARALGVALRPGAASSPASPTRSRRASSPCSVRSRSRPGRARWRRGCCCRWSLGSTAGSPRRAAALSRCRGGLVGGVNAAATFAVLPLGVIWLLTRTPRSATSQLMVWWPAFTLLGHAVVAGPAASCWAATARRSSTTSRRPSVTTFPTTLFDTLRGTSNWVAYVDPDSRAGNDLVTARLPRRSTAASCCSLGFAGLARPPQPAPAVPRLSAAGRPADGDRRPHGRGPRLASPVPCVTLLDGSLAPLRNVHKFDPVIRLPLVLGLAFVVERLLAARRAIPRSSDRRRGACSTGPTRPRAGAGRWCGLVGDHARVLAGRIEPASPVAGVPAYWQQTADWLADHPDDGTALLAPGSAFGHYLWGAPEDEPLQSLGALAVGGAQRHPARARRATSGCSTPSRTGSPRATARPGSRAYLRRAGVGYLVVRNDLDPSSDVPDPVLVHQAIGQSPGSDRVATFGPDVGGGAHLDARTDPDGRQRRVAGGVPRGRDLPGAGRLVDHIGKQPDRGASADPRTSSTWLTTT